jgi:glucokinase-like ROK family protein
MTSSKESNTNQPPSAGVPIFLSRAEAEIVRILWMQPSVSRPDIASITGWSKAKTSQQIQNLISKGYLVEAGEEASQGGRRPRLLHLNDKLGFLVGLDIGATSIDVVLADVSGQVLQRRSEPADVRHAPDAFLSRCSELILDMVTTQPCRPDQILGIGVGVPGPVDFTRGVLVAPPLMPLWENFPIRSFFQKTFPAAYVVIDNDVNIMALGEQRAGNGVGIDDFLFVKIGTGIGCGIVSNGKMHRGSKGCAGDIGHICVDKTGPICRCGNTGCLEAMAAGPAIVEKALKAAKNGSSTFLRQVMEDNGGVLRPEDVSAACREGDQAALEIVRTSGQMIGDVLASLVNFFNPSHIFIGGGITNIGHHLLIAIRQAVLHRSLPLATIHLSINFSRMGAEVGVTGALALAREYLFIVEGHPFLTTIPQSLVFNDRR